MTPGFVRLDEEMLLGRARELLAQPAPDHDNLWEISQRIGALKHYVTELAAALELRRAAEPHS